jgi:hypothetical protein
MGKAMKAIILLLIALVLVPLLCRAQNPDPSKDWNADVSVYALAAGMSGNTTVHGIPADVNARFYHQRSDGTLTGLARQKVDFHPGGLPLVLCRLHNRFGIKSVSL